MNGILQELFQANIYKRTQGRITRQVTLGALVVAIFLGFWRLHQMLMVNTPQTIVNWGLGDSWPAIAMGVPFALAILGGWIAFRLVNIPRFADFLIAVEAEMNKVSWPTRAELFRSCVVVLVCIVLLTFVLWLYDGFWYWLLRSLGLL